MIILVKETPQSLIPARQSIGTPFVLNRFIKSSMKSFYFALGLRMSDTTEIEFYSPIDKTDSKTSQTAIATGGPLGDTMIHQHRIRDTTRLKRLDQIASDGFSILPG